MKCGNVDISNRVLSCIKKGNFNDGFIIGQCPSFQLELSLNNKDDFFNDKLNELFYYTEPNSTKEYVFVAYEMPERYTKELKLKLYDRSYELDVAYATQLDYESNQVTILDQLSEMERLTGFSFDVTNVPAHVLERIVKWYDNTITIRSYLKWIAELFAANIFAEGENNFVFKQLSKKTTHKTLIASDYLKEEVFTISRVCFDNSLIKAEQGDTSANTLYISCNNLYVEDDNKDEIVQGVYNVIGGLSIYSLDSLITKNISDVQLGDIVNYNDEFNFMITEISSKLTSASTIVQTLKGRMVSKNEEKQINRIDNTTQIRALRVVFNQEKLKWSVTAQEVEGQNEKIAKLELSTDEINQSITKIEETVQKIDITYYHADLTCSGTSITRDNSSITMSVQLLNKSDEVPTSDSAFNWKRVSSNAESDTAWNNAHKARKSITITSSDLEASANFYCDVSAAEWQGSTSAVTVVDEVKSQVPVGMLTPNLPTTQTLDEDGHVTPKWGLEIIPSMTFGIFSPDIADITTVWKRRINDEALTDLTAKEVVKDNVLTVTVDILSDTVRSVTYYCYMQYEYSTCMAEKTFTLVKDGQSGTDGISIVSTATMYAVNDSDEEEPTTGWITSRPERAEGQFMWRKLRIVYSDGTHTETEAECVTGDKGDAGKGIKSYTITYQASTSGTTAPIGEWLSTIPTVQQGQYLWSRTITTYTDDKTSTAYSVSYIPVNGTSVSVKSTSVMYQVSTNGTTAPTGEWKSSIPTVPKGQYLWTRTIVTYTDDKSTTAYSVSYQPVNGSNGTSVTVSSTKTTYQASNSGTTEPTGTWSDTPVAGTAGQYVWTRTIVTYSDGKSTTSYSISRNGNNGATGATGTSTASTVQQYFLSTSKVNPTGGTWTTTPPTWSSGKYLWTRFVITYKNPTSTEYTVPVCDSSWEAVNEIEVGGRNLLLKSNYPVTNTSYPTKTYTMTEKMVANETYTCTLWGTLGTGKSHFGLWLDGGNIGLGSLVKISDGIYQLTFKGKTGTLDTSVLHVYPVASTVSAESTITKIKLEKGNKATDWSPAPEDVQDDINNAVNNATNEINTTINTTNERIDTLNSSVQKISETVTKTSKGLASTSSKVLSIESTVNGHSLSISKIDTIENQLTGKVDQKELKVYCDFTEENNSPQLRLGSSATDTQSYITDNGFRVEYKGVVKTKVDVSGLIADTVFMKKADFEDNHAIFKNDNRQLIIQ